MLANLPFAADKYVTYRHMKIIRSWREQKVMLKWRFPNLSDDDFYHEPGERETMLQRLEAKLKKTREEVEYLFVEIQHY